MPSHPFDTGWDFGPVLGLIDSDLHITSPPHSPTSQTVISLDTDKHLGTAASGPTIRLGSFGKLFEELRLPDSQSIPPISPVEPVHEDSSSSEDALNYVPIEIRDAKGTSGGGENVSSSSDEHRETSADPQSRMTGKQIRKARKKAAKERKALKKSEEISQTERAQKDLETFKKPTIPETPIRNIEVAPKQVRGPLKPNVGAKIRPATPVQIDPLVNAREQPYIPVPQATMVAKLTLPPTSRYDTMPLQLPNSLGQPFTPARPSALFEHNIPSFQHVPTQDDVFPTLANLESALATQPLPFATPTPVQYVPSSGPGQVYGYFTPQVTNSMAYGHNLIPRTVQPIILPRPSQPAAISQQAQPPVTPGKPTNSLTIRPQTDRHLHFFNQLIETFPEDKKWLVSPMQLCNEKSTAEGIHIFVDASNIMIGFKDRLRKCTDRRFDMSFDSLALLLERRRPVAKRVFAGSHRESAPLPHVTKLVETSKAVGYENNVKEQVFIRREDSERKRFFKEVERVGWTKAVQRSGNGSGSDSEMGQPVPSTPSAPKWVEQGVDEILHLKMCQSIIDTEVPTTMVLATGDGAGAEHSDGFLAHVERALKKGWKVELVSWRQQTSSGYKNRKFKLKWGAQFRIIELDEYLESLIDTP